MDYTQIQEVSTIWQGVGNKKEKAKRGTLGETSIKLIQIFGSWKNRKIIAIKGISYRPTNQWQEWIQAIRSLIKSANLFKRLGEWVSKKENASKLKSQARKVKGKDDKHLQIINNKRAV